MSGCLLLVPVLGLALTAAGCQGTGSRTQDEPFFGSGPLSMRKDPPYNHKPSDASEAPAKPLPVPSDHSLTSTATAAGQQGDATSAGVTPVVPPPPSPTGATLAPPQALEGNISRSGPAAPPAGPAAVTMTPTTKSTFEQLQQELKQRGMRYQWWQNVDETGEWKFTCSVLTDPSNPNLLTTYKQSSYGDCGVGAMRDVLQKIDQNRLKAR